MDETTEARRAKRAAYNAEYHAANREKLNAKKAARNRANPDTAAAYRAANKERIAAQKAAYYIANRDKRAAHYAEYRAANREKLNAKAAAYHVANRDMRAAYGAAYNAANREMVTAKKRVKNAEMVVNLCDSYIKSVLRQQDWLNPAQELIELKRVQLQIKRHVKGELK